MIGIYWPEMKYTDELRESMLTRAEKGVKHEMSPINDGKPGEAKCDVTIDNENVLLDYRPYDQQNWRKVEAGVMRLEFTDATRKTLKAVHWEAVGQKEYKHCEFNPAPYKFKK